MKKLDSMSRGNQLIQGTEIGAGLMSLEINPIALTTKPTIMARTIACRCHHMWNKLIHILGEGIPVTSNEFYPRPGMTNSLDEIRQGKTSLHGRIPLTYEG